MMHSTKAILFASHISSNLIIRATLSLSYFSDEGPESNKDNANFLRHKSEKLWKLRNEAGPSGPGPVLLTTIPSRE